MVILESGRSESAPVAELLQHLTRFLTYCWFSACGRLLKVWKRCAHVPRFRQQCADIQMRASELRLELDRLLVFLNRWLDLSLGDE